MATPLFITVAYLKDNSNLDENVDEKKARVAILEAQDMRLKTVLGTALYEYYVTNINANTVPASGVYKVLIDSHIVPFLKYWALYELAPFLAVGYRNKGVMQQNGENAQNVDMTILEKLREEHKDKAEWYGEQMIKYCIENETSIPEWDNNPDYDDLQSSKGNFDSPIYTPSNNQCIDAKDRYIQL